MAAMRVALVHDWLTGMRGGEKVLAELCDMFPGAPVYTLVHVPGSTPPIESDRKIIASTLDRVPFGRTHYRLFLPLFPLLARTLSIEQDVDLVISSSHAVAMSVRAPRGALHVCYCHSPMRYVWGCTDDYYAFGSSRLARWAALALFRPYLRRWDGASSKRVDVFLANSDYVRRQISADYGRDATVVHPPVDLEFFTPSDVDRTDAGLVVSALVPHKRVDLAIRAFSDRGWRLKIVGDGIERRPLERVAGPTVEFLGRVPDDLLRELYRTSRLLVVPGREDFGIVAVEAQACGLPVVALAEGGALETVSRGVTGELFTERTPDALAQAVELAIGTTYSTAALRRNAERFGRDRFRTRVRALLEGLRNGQPAATPGA